MLRTTPYLLFAFVLCSCADNQTLQPDTRDAVSDFGIETVAPSCTPNLDGQITADELIPAVGIPVSFRVALGEQPVDVVGAPQSDGSVLWDWTWDASADQVYVAQAESLDDKWYASSFETLSGESFVLDFDLGGEVEAVYEKDTSGVWLYGLASREENGPRGKTLLIYDEPVQLYRFPLEVGAEWVSTGRIRDGVLSGLPYAGRDIYTFEVDAVGRLELPDLTFDPVLRVRTHIALQPAVGQAVSQHQVAFVFECFGEVARATSPRDTNTPDFDTASEIRRLAL